MTPGEWVALCTIVYVLARHAIHCRQTIRAWLKTWRW